MPSVSRSQQRAAGMAMAAKDGKMPAARLVGAAKAMMKMSDSDLKKFASTPRRGLPVRRK